jgi:hypothetical protein
MPISLTYPSGRFGPPHLPDLTSKEQRGKLSPSALKAFFKIVDAWGVKDQDARQLLGGVSNGPYYQLKKNPDAKLLSQDQLLRISYLIGIFRALKVLHGKDIAKRWVSLRNSNRIFDGMSPLEYMIKGGTPAMQTVRRLLESRMQGS